jgi:Carboxypeptidase regulatory-like domain
MGRTRLVFLVVAIAILSAEASGQGETTSAIQGQATDVTGAVVRGATVTIASRDTGSKRSAKTDEAGRFNFPQLKPGAYTVRVEAPGFEPQAADNVFSGLGQKQTVNFTLRVARSNETVGVSSEAPIINPSNANT